MLFLQIMFGSYLGYVLIESTKYLYRLYDEAYLRPKKIKRLTSKLDSLSNVLKQYNIKISPPDHVESEVSLKNTTKRTH